MKGVRNTGTVCRSITEVFLDGLDFPVRKDEVMIYAEDNDAPPEVLDFLDGLSDRHFHNMDDLMQGLAQVG